MSRKRPDGVDYVTDAFLSDSAYDRLRLQRGTYFTQPITTKLTWQSVLLGCLALLLPLYALFPAAVASYLPTTDPSLASPKVLVLGLIGAVVELLTAAVLVATALYRVRNHPLSESQARTTLDFEDLASYLGFGTGGLAIGLTLCYFLLGVAGGEAVSGYVASMGGVNPFVDSGLGLSVTGLATVAFVGCVVLLSVSVYLRYRLLGVERR